MAARNNAHKTTSFREQLGDTPVALNDYRVDELRRMASEFHIASSHDLKKPELITAINKAKTTANTNN